MIKRIVGLTVTTLAVTAASFGVATAPAQATGHATGKVTSKINLRMRSGPTTTARTIGSVPPRSHLRLACKTHGTTVGGNTTWYRLSNGHRWVSARYVANVGAPPGWCASGGSTSHPAPSKTQHRQALRHRTPKASHVVVAVPGGYEAATFDQSGHIRFWHSPKSSTAWRQVGHSRYPKNPQAGGPRARVKGALLGGMQHATFIVHGLFTGDASGNAVAFTTGPHGWGTIKAKSGGNIGSSGQTIGSNMVGLSYDFAFAHGNLQTKDCPSNRVIAECGSHPVVKQWHWNGNDFTRIR